MRTVVTKKYKLLFVFSAACEKFIWDKINYIHNNPVDSGFVKLAEEWIYSSASNYQEMESIIEVERLSQRLITY